MPSHLKTLKTTFDEDNSGAYLHAIKMTDFKGKVQDFAFTAGGEFNKETNID